MGKKEAARQRQLAKKKSKRDNKRKELARRTSHDPTIALEHIASTPVYDAQIPDKPSQGMGVAVIARRLPDGRIAYASYLLDTYCLGVKDVFWHIKSPAEYHEYLDQSQRAGRSRKVSGECVAKLVLGAVEYARSHGFSPHEDFRHARRLLEGINPTVCTEEFEYGYNGRPMFIQGPYDTPARINQIMARLGESGETADGLIEPRRGQLLINP
ncbi:MAG TPA: hypothetical protein VGP68_13155, partial [Gemmataceae bacterium]|nr:hypothetical protein [Gemmataceae bacterium]